MYEICLDFNERLSLDLVQLVIFLLYSVEVISSCVRWF
jgi:hypothetical protein